MARFSSYLLSYHVSRSTIGFGATAILRRASSSLRSLIAGIAATLLDANESGAPSG